MKHALPLLVALETLALLVLIALYVCPPAAADSGAPPVAVPAGEVEGHTVWDEAEAAAGADPAPRAPEISGREDAPWASESSVLFGRAVDEAGLPVDRLSVLLERGVPIERHQVFTSQDGNYALAGVAPGEWRVRLLGSGIVPALEQITVGRRPGAERRDWSVRRTRPLVIEAVTPSGQALGEAMIAAGLSWSLVCQAIATRERPDGRFALTSARSLQRLGVATWRSRHGVAREDDLRSLPETALGILELETAPPVWVSLVLRQELLATQPLAPGTESLRFVVPIERVTALLAALEVQVLDAETGAPLEGIRVAVSDTQSSNSGIPTDAAGRVRIERISPGLKELDIYAGADFESYRRQLDLTAGDTTTLPPIRLGRARSLRLQLLDAEGRPCVAEVAVQGTDDVHDLVPRRRRFAATAADGSFEQASLGARRYLVTAQQNAGLFALRVLDLAAPTNHDTTLRLEQAWHVTLEAPRHAEARLHYKIVGPEGLPYAYGQFWAGRPTTALLPAGGYELLVHDGRELRHRSPFRVRSAALTVRVP